MTIGTGEIYLKGTPICRGIAIGNPFLFSYTVEDIPHYLIEDRAINEELERYRNALEDSREELKKLKRKLKKEHIAEGVAILECHLQLLDDPLLTTSVEHEIMSQKKNAEFAFYSLIEKYQERFNQITDTFFRDRFKELIEISRRIMAHLRDGVRISLGDIPKGSIVFALELSAPTIAEANKCSVTAFVTELGGATSHAAILAKAKGIPYVSDVSFGREYFHHEDPIIVDGRLGHVILNPTKKTLKYYRNLQQEVEKHTFSLGFIDCKAPETIDGYQVKLTANIDSVNDIYLLHQHGASGVGLYRSEYILDLYGEFPTEEEQFQAYREVVDQLEGKPIVFRTFDIGGDKIFHNRFVMEEGNPYLGCRAIRYFLKNPKLFKSQVGAILRTSECGEVSIMFPMISSLTEFLEAKSLVREVHQELMEKGHKIGTYKIGCMIEVPSAAIIADLLAKECDFLSIGTNDLVQYALAVDRGNHQISNLYTPAHPSVIRLIKMIVNEANRNGIKVSVCGEVAADPRFTQLLFGLGVHELSVSINALPIIKNAIRHMTIVAACKLAEHVLSLSDAIKIQEYLAEQYQKVVPHDCLFNC